MREHERDKQVEPLMRGELTDLGLNHSAIGDDGAEIVANFLKHDETVRTVSLFNCNIGPRGAEAIAESLKHNQTVEYLNLYANPIGDERAEALINTVNYNVCIIWLFVGANNIAPELQATLEYVTETRNKNLIPAAVCRASLFLIAARRNIADAGNLTIFLKEIVKMIAMEVWATRKDPIWISALTESERTGE